MTRRFVATIGINDLIDFLLTKRSPKLSSKDWELHIAVVLAKFQSKQAGEEYLIGLPIKERTRREALAAGSANDLRRIIEDFIDEDAAQDIYLTAESEVANRLQTTPKGHGFQIKRVLHDPSDGILDDFIINYLNITIPGKYGKAVNTSLVLVFSTKTAEEGSLNVQAIRDGLRITTFPFDRILIAVPGKDEITFGEVWPEFGAAYYTKDQFDRI
jgi:hypothetical protein